MRDTAQEVEDRYNRMLLRLSPQERLEMGCRMFAAAKALVRAAVIQGGAATESEIRMQIFLRFYRNDFSEAERARILSRIGQADGA